LSACRRLSFLLNQKRNKKVKAVPVADRLAEAQKSKRKKLALTSILFLDAHGELMSAVKKSTPNARTAFLF
jgi:hypothetical protein